MLDRLELIAGRVALSVLAEDALNAKEIWEAGRGSVVPAIAAARYRDEAELREMVRATAASVPLVSAALGGGADHRQWRKVLAAGRTGAQHLNQPFSTGAYVKGACPKAWVNGVVAPSGRRSRVVVQTLGGAVIELDATSAAQLARDAQLDAVKVHPASPETGPSVVVEVARAVADAGVRGLEPAGGLDLDSTPRLLARLMDIPRLLLIPHVFGAVQDPDGRTDPHLVEALVDRVVVALT